MKIIWRIRQFESKFKNFCCDDFFQKNILRQIKIMEKQPILYSLQQQIWFKKNNRMVEFEKILKVGYIVGKAQLDF